MGTDPRGKSVQNELLPRPPHLEAMIECAEKLADGFDFLFGICRPVASERAVRIRTPLGTNAKVE